MSSRENHEIIDLLSSRYGLSAQPGTKVECPSCRKNNFYIFPDTPSAHCFTPGCGFHVSASTSYRYIPNDLQTLMEKFFQKSKNEFHHQIMDKSGAAYDYCVNERNIHPKVLEFANIGIIPNNFDIDVYLNAARGMIEEEFAKPNSTKSGKKKTKSNDEDSEKDERLGFVEEQFAKLKKLLENNKGELCFFYTNGNNQFTGFRCRKPGTKIMQSFKAFPKFYGVFDFSRVRDAYQFQRHWYDFNTKRSDTNRPTYEGELIVVEGEFNALQLQSLCWRQAEKNDRRYFGFLPIWAVGSATNTTFHYNLNKSPNVGRNLIICWDNDDGGLEFVNAVNESISFYGFTTPAWKTDLDEYIRSFGDDVKAAWKEVWNIIAHREFYPRSVEGVKKEINSVRNYRSFKGRNKLKEHEIHQICSEIFLNNCLERGKFYFDEDQNAYFFDEVEKDLIEINDENLECKLLLEKYDLIEIENLCKYAMAKLKTIPFKVGEPAEIHDFSYYCPKKNALYVYNHNNQVYCINKSGIEVKDNGVDGLLFRKNRYNESFDGKTEKKSKDWNITNLLCDNIQFSHENLSPQESRVLVTLYFYSLFFPNVMPTKPILAWIGQPGSGKSSTCRKMGKLIFGKNFNVSILTHDEKDFDANVTNSQFVVFDNVDSPVKWFMDRLAAAATGANLNKRSYFTTNTLQRFMAKAFIALTSRNPHFMRDDIADRLVGMRVDPLEKPIADNVINREIDEHRDEIMAHMLTRLQHILKAFEEWGDKPCENNLRMADFGEFVIKVCSYVRKEEIIGTSVIQVNSMLKKLKQEQSTFALENDPLVNLILHYIEGEPDHKPQGSAKLHAKFETIAKQHRLDYDVSGSQSLGQRLGVLRKDSDSVPFYIELKEGGGRTRSYRFILKDGGDRRDATKATQPLSEDSSAILTADNVTHLASTDDDLDLDLGEEVH